MNPYIDDDLQALAEHTRLKRVCLAQKPPAKLQDFIRGLILRAISPERAG
jgi:hypothetical protein